MAKQVNLPSITNKIYELLKDLTPEERKRITKAAFTLLGDNVQLDNQLDESGVVLGEQQDLKKAKEYFESKNPNSKIEEIAIACRFRELISNEHVHTKDDISKVFDEARRNFDGHNFKRDLENSKKSGLFTRGKEIKLSYIGQKHVDALPDREKLKSLRKPRKRKPSKKKKSAT